ncbi:MAG: hypothetical protein GY750_01130 [Lentisphaerae bacterium]|nr:hypothetical protein [Lentisphaerota bacterium]
MKFKKVLYYDYRQSDDELLPPFLISYVKKGIHGLVAISCKVGDSYYILYSLGLFVTGSDTSSASVSGPLGKRNAKVFFDEISRSQASPDVQAVHYASTKTRACELYTKMLEIERSQQVMKWFRMMNLNCHNFASFVMVAGGIVDDQFLGGIIAVKGNSYSLERVKLSSLDKGAEQKFFLKLRDKSNDQYIYQQKTKQCFINLNNCTCCRYRYGGQGLSIFKWPAGITIQDSCSHSPAKSLFEDVDTAEKHYFSGEKFRLRQAKALLKAYAGSNFWGKKNYVGDISNLVMQRMSWSATSNSFNYISELLT